MRSGHGGVRTAGMSLRKKNRGSTGTVSIVDGLGAMMSVDEQCKQMIRHHEGYRALPYRDTEGWWTVGIGHNMQRPLSAKAIEQIFEDDIAEAEASCRSAFPWFAELAEQRQWVLIDMCFNLGLSRLLKFHQMLTAIQNGLYDTAADEMLDSLWSKQVKGRALELANLMRGSVQV